MPAIYKPDGPVRFDPDSCFVVSLKFDETLDGDEGIEVVPSRLYDGEHHGIGGELRECPAPVS